MTEYDRSEFEPDDENDYGATPSQAEGDRETVEEDLKDKFGEGGRPVAGGGEPRTTPSQAEGDRETVEEDLDRKEGGRERPQKR